MQLFKRIVYQSLALIVLISASGFRVSIHHCCGKIKEINFFAESKCPMHKKSVGGNTQTNKQTSLLAGKSCCYNQQISIHNNIQNSVEKAPMRSLSMPVLYLIQSLFNNWFGSDKNIEVRVKPYILWYQEPLNILFKQLRI